MGAGGGEDTDGGLEGALRDLAGRDGKEGVGGCPNESEKKNDR